MAKFSGKYKVAAVQAAPVFMDLKGGIDKSIQLIKEAAAAGAKLIAFPENFLPGYPWFVWLDSPAWSMQFMAQYRSQALTLGSAEYQVLEKAAAEHGIYVVLGFTERDAGSLYMAQAIINDEGKTIATRRKVKPTLIERIVFGEGDGSDLAVHETELGNIGALCCWEHVQPLNKAAMFSQHEQVHIAAWPSFSVYKGVSIAISGPVNNAVTRSYAVEGQCYVIAPCAIVSQEMIDLLCSKEEHHELLKKGGGFARIYGPDGADLGGELGENEEGILYADVDLIMQDLAKVAGDSMGHYARNDVTRLVLNSASHREVHAWPSGASWNTSLPVTLPETTADFSLHTDEVDFPHDTYPQRDV